ncbi:hypothetical protein ACMGD3_05400 [Lysinibacillus sphaericus]
MGNWYSKSAFAFKPEQERLKLFDDEPGTNYYFYSYLRSFVDNY